MMISHINWRSRCSSSVSSPITILLHILRIKRNHYSRSKIQRRYRTPVNPNTGLPISTPKPHHINTPKPLQRRPASTTMSIIEAVNADIRATLTSLNLHDYSREADRIWKLCCSVRADPNFSKFASEVPDVKNEMSRTRLSNASEMPGVMSVLPLSADTFSTNTGPRT